VYDVILTSSGYLRNSGEQYFNLCLEIFTTCNLHGHEQALKEEEIFTRIIFYINNKRKKSAKSVILGASPKWGDLGDTHGPKSCSSD